MKCSAPVGWPAAVMRSYETSYRLGQISYGVLSLVSEANILLPRCRVVYDIFSMLAATSCPELIAQLIKTSRSGFESWPSLKVFRIFFIVEDFLAHLAN